MVEKLKNLEGVVATAIENLVVFSYINKTAIFDLAQREIVAEFKTRYNSYFNHIAFGKYIGINAQCPVIIDLETKEVIAKFNAQSIYKKYFLKKPNKYDMYNYAESIWIKDITDKEIICCMRYRISSEWYSALCAFSFSTLELLHYDCVDGSGGRYYKYNRQEPQYSFLEYNEDILKTLSDEIKSKKQFRYNEKRPLHIWFYNKKYNVAFFANEILYSYYIDDNGSANVTNKEKNIFLDKRKIEGCQMVEKLKNVWGVSITGIENLVVFSYYNKTAVFDLEKREIVAEFKTPDAESLWNVEFGKYIGIYATIPCLIDLEKMEIVKKFNAQSIIKKYLIDPKYKSKEYDLDFNGIKIVDIVSNEILCYVMYYVTDGKGMFEGHHVLCTFDISTFELLHWENVIVDVSGYRHNRNEIKYSYIEYDESIINDLMSLINIKKAPNFRVICYHKKYNVIFFRNGDYCYSYYIDDNGSADKIDTAENDFLIQLGNNEQKFIRQNGLTAEVLKYLEPEVTLDGGYFWALDSIERKAKQFNMSFDDVVDSDIITDEELILYTIGLLETEIEEGIGQYFTTRDEKEISRLIKALQLIGATNTVKIIEKGIKLKKADKDMFDEEYEELVEKLDEDYVGLAIDYIKKIKGLA